MLPLQIEDIQFPDLPPLPGPLEIDDPQLLLQFLQFYANPRDLQEYNLLNHYTRLSLNLLLPLACLCPPQESRAIPSSFSQKINPSHLLLAAEVVDQAISGGHPYPRFLLQILSQARRKTPGYSTPIALLTLSRALESDDPKTAQTLERQATRHLTKLSQLLIQNQDTPATDFLERQQIVHTLTTCADYATPATLRRLKNYLQYSLSLPTSSLNTIKMICSPQESPAISSPSSFFITNNSDLQHISTLLTLHRYYRDQQDPHPLSRPAI